MKPLGLSFVWGIRCRLRAEGAKLRAEGDKLRAEGAKLRAEGDKLWAEAVIEVHGNVVVEWRWRAESGAEACVVEGETFEPLPSKATPNG